MQMMEAIEILSATKAPKKDGKGNSYADPDKPAHALAGRNADGIQKGI